MKTPLDKFKETYAIKEGFDSWLELRYKMNETSMMLIMDKVCEEYALTLSDDKEKRNATIQEGIDALKELVHPEDLCGITIWNNPNYNHGVDNAIKELEKLKKS